MAYQIFEVGKPVTWKNPKKSCIADFIDECGQPPYEPVNVVPVPSVDQNLTLHPQFVYIKSKAGLDIKFSGAWFTKV